MPELLILNVFFVLSTVAFPVYSRMGSDRARLGDGYLYSVRIYSLYGVCAGVGVAVSAPLLVPVVFGDPWRGAIAPLVALALYASCRAIGVGANDVYKAIGRPGLSLWISLVRLAVLVPALWLGAVTWGITGSPGCRWRPRWPSRSSCRQWPSGCWASGRVGSWTRWRPPSWPAARSPLRG